MCTPGNSGSSQEGPGALNFPHALASAAPLTPHPLGSPVRPLLASAITAACAALVAATTLPAAVAATTGPSVVGAPSGRAAVIRDARANAERDVLGRHQAGLVRDVVADRSGTTHVRFDRTWRGLDVVGGDFVVHQDANGRLLSTSGRTIGRLKLSAKPTLSAGQAARKAARRVSFDVATSSPRLVVLAGRTPTLTYRVNVEGRAASGAPRGTYVFVDARTGRTVARWASELNEVGSGSSLFLGDGVPVGATLTGGTYTMVDPARGNNETHNGPYASSAPLFSGPDNLWGLAGSASNAEDAGVDAQFGIATTWDYYKNTFGRTGIANDGKGARSYVHDGTYVNASWSDSCFCMKYGDGDASTYYPLVELDIAGHEMTHGVTSRTANLQYRGESGGLNEATSDIMGTNVEYAANNAGDPGDYVIGEEIFRSYNPATNFIRRMDKPSLDGASQDCWTRRTKSVDVHYSSGVANHFYFLLSEGSGARTLGGVAYNSPTCNGSTVTGIGRATAQVIWYDALTRYMTSTTTYAGARTATINAACARYGASSTQVAAVKAAWSAVAVG